MLLLLLFAICIFFLSYALVNTKRLQNGNKKKLPPGPMGVPLLGYLPFMGPVPCQTVTNLSKKWGDIFTLQLGQYPVVFVNDFAKMKELFKLDSMTGRVQLELFEKRGVYGLVLLEGNDWKEVRRFLLKSLKDIGFGKKTMESSIQEEVSQIVDLLKTKEKEPVYLKPIIELSVINALWYLLTSEKYDIQDPAKQKVAHIMSEGISEQNIIGIAAFLPWMARILPHFSGYAKALEYFDAPEEMAKDVLEKHVERHSPGNEKDFIDHALTKIYATTDPSSMFYKDVGMRNLHYTLIDLFFAGSDTLSSTLGWALLYLSMWPGKQAKVHHEIDRVVGSNCLPSLDDRIRMPQTEATMWEVMRMSTMVPFGLFHKALEDIEFEDYFFPRGTYFLANLYKNFKEEEYWGDPETFRPERFINEDGAFQKDERMIPFFVGKRTCIGEALAMTEYFLFFTGILQSFRFVLSPDDPTPDIGPRSGFVLQPPKHKLIPIKRICCDE